ncbi:MAG: LPS export ABC transporter permease LptF [Geminicoccaceae bacterium]|jgi:lipopolysaccharide export system permease protein
MKIYLRYLVWQLVLPTFLATVAFSGAVWLSQSLRFVDLIVNKGLPLTTFLYLTALLFPSLLLVVMPFALFCAVLFVYHRLSSESELVVMKAVGLSNLQLAIPGLVVALIVTAIGYANSLYFMPAAFRDFKDLQFEIKRDFSHLLLQPGVFNAPVPNLTVYVREAEDGGKLGGILVHDERVPDRPVTMMAEHGVLLQGKNGPVFALENGNRQELTRSEEGQVDLSLLHFDSYTLDLTTAATPTGKRDRRPKELFLGELFSPDDKELSDQQRQRLITEGHKRVTWPLNALVFAVIGMTVLLTRRHDRQGPWQGMLVAVLSVVTVQALSTASSSLAIREPTLVPLLYLVPFTPIVICSALLLKYRPLRLAQRSAGLKEA